MHILKSKNILFGLLLSLLQGLHAQTLMPIQHEAFMEYESLLKYHREVVQEDFALRPFLVVSNINMDSVLLNQYGINPLQNKGWFYRKLRMEHFGQVRTEHFDLDMDVLFDFQLGKDLAEGEQLVTNTRGGRLAGRLGKSLFFESTIFENQASFPSYIDIFIKKYNVVPGMGEMREFGKNMYDYASSSGKLIFMPYQNFLMMAGHTKQFIGHGYRSLLLSDAGFDYPLLYFQVQYGKVIFSKWYSLLIYDVDQIGDRVLPRKAASFNYLAWKPWPFLEAGIFEGNLWKNPDEKGNFTWNLDLLNPIPGVNAFHSDNNSILGLDLSAHLLRWATIYGQIVLDDAMLKDDKRATGQANKVYAMQMGIKYRPVWRNRALLLQMEYNKASRGMYFSADSTINYTHYNQPLAHPIGAGFNELVFRSGIRYKSMKLNFQYNLINRLKDSVPGNYTGNDLFYGIRTDLTSEPEFNSHINYFNTQLAYVLNPLSQMQLMIGLQYRKEQYLNENLINQVLYFGFQTNLRNIYFDF